MASKKVGWTPRKQKRVGAGSQVNDFTPGSFGKYTAPPVEGITLGGELNAYPRDPNIHDIRHTRPWGNNNDIMQMLLAGRLGTGHVGAGQAMTDDEAAQADRLGGAKWDDPRYIEWARANGRMGLPPTAPLPQPGERRTQRMWDGVEDRVITFEYMSMGGTPVWVQVDSQPYTYGLPPDEFASADAEASAPEPKRPGQEFLEGLFDRFDQATRGPDTVRDEEGERFGQPTFQDRTYVPPGPPRLPSGRPIRA